MTTTSVHMHGKSKARLMPDGLVLSACFALEEGGLIAAFFVAGV